MAPRFRNKGSLNSFVILARENVGRIWRENGGMDATEIPNTFLPILFFKSMAKKLRF